MSAERLVQLAQKTYGIERSAAMAEEMSSAAPAQRAQLMQQYAKEIVTQSSPAKYTKK